jgi:Transglutaminase-like superfamily
MKLSLTFGSALILLAGIAHADLQVPVPTYLALYLQGSKIGYASYLESDALVDGHALKRNDSVTVMDTALIGSSLKIQIDSTTWSTAAGKPVRMKFVINSGGRSQKVNAIFGAKSVALDILNGKTATKSTLPLPNGSVVDDPLPLVMNGKVAIGTTKELYVLDPLTISFVKNQVKLVGPSTVSVDGKTVNATLVEVSDPRATMRVFLTAKGDLIKVESAMGIEMRPATQAVALGPSDKGAKVPDLAYSTCIKPDKSIEAPRYLKSMKLELEAKISNLPVDESQTVSPIENGHLVTIHPVSPDLTAKTDKVRASQISWTKPSLNIPSDSTRFVTLAKRVVGPETRVAASAEKIRTWVYDQMSPNAGIGVLRNANEVLDTKEGVCRDYAVLTTTVLRAAGIPARLVAGLVYAEGAFFYHAWAEAWDGKHWFGVDSTVPESRFSASHIKLAQGNVDGAFTFTFLEGAKIKILDARG